MKILVYLVLHLHLHLAIHLTIQVKLWYSQLLHRVDSLLHLEYSNKQDLKVI
jgi:hypothetical protein